MGTYSDEDPNAGVGERLVNAIRKTVKSASQLAAPRSVAEIKQREQDATDEGQHDPSTLARMRTGQSSDTNNSYNF
jgi:hypothetical protein